MRDGTLILRHGSLFSGIGGFDLAAERCGWKNIFHCELDPFCRQVLNYYFPKAQSYGDIKETDFSSHKGGIDILTGGFPCQPYSTAGKRLGKEDPRHLWPDMLRAIREIQPLWVVGENVRGLISWNGGLVFHEVQSDLEAEGYEVLPFLLPAAGVNAPHRRERIWFIAYRDSIGRKEKWGNTEGPKKRATLRTDLFTQSERPGEKRTTADTNGDGGPHPEYNRTELSEEEREFSYCGDHGIAADTDCPGFQKKRTQQQAAGFEQYGELGELTADTDSAGIQRRQASEHVACREPVTVKHTWGHDQPSDWQGFPTQSPVCNGDDGFPSGLDGITFPKWRSESIKAGGNAIVPQVALRIFRTIQQLQIKFQMQRP
jgi:DNA (cytosine-5)-methyltransferase 1